VGDSSLTPICGHSIACSGLLCGCCDESMVQNSGFGAYFPNPTMTSFAVLKILEQEALRVRACPVGSEAVSGDPSGLLSKGSVVFVSFPPRLGWRRVLRGMRSRRRWRPRIRSLGRRARRLFGKSLASISIRRSGFVESVQFPFFIECAVVLAGF